MPSASYKVSTKTKRLTSPSRQTVASSDEYPTLFHDTVFHDTVKPYSSESMWTADFVRFVLPYATNLKHR